MKQPCRICDSTNLGCPARFLGDVVIGDNVNIEKTAGSIPGLQVVRLTQTEAPALQPSLEQIELPRITHEVNENVDV